MTQISLLLVTSNGAGMGHLARQLAVGLAGRSRARSTLMSMSAALPTVTSLGIQGEYCPGPGSGWIPEPMWDQYVAARIQTLATQVSADVVVFDGVAPYRGVTLAKTRMRGTPFVWFRRGMWRKDVNDRQLWKSGLFDLVIEPGDLGGAADDGPTSTLRDAKRVSPVSLADVLDPLPRKEAAERLGLDPMRDTILMTLGTGRLGDVESIGRPVLDALIAESDSQIGVVTSAIASSEIPHELGDRVVEIRGVFPLVRYLTAFDAAVSAAGYNSVHELIPATLPTLLIPNTATRTDNQVGRAAAIADRGLALMANPTAPADVRAQVVRLVDPGIRNEISSTIERTDRHEIAGGAGDTADLLFNLVTEFEPTPLSFQTRGNTVLDSMRAEVKRILGPKMTNQVRRLLGRPTYTSPDMLRVALTDPTSPPPPSGVRPLLFTDRPSPEQLLGDDPIEHILPGASAAYRSERELNARRFYDVVSPG